MTSGCGEDHLAILAHLVVTQELEATWAAECPGDLYTLYSLPIIQNGLSRNNLDAYLVFDIEIFIL